MWLRKAYLAFHRQVNARMLKYGITADQFVILRVVAREPGLSRLKLSNKRPPTQIPWRQFCGCWSNAGLFDGKLMPTTPERGAYF
jgi:hypothetical protein